MNILVMNTTIPQKLMQMMNLMRDRILQTVLYKDDAFQTDNVNFEGENEEANQAQFERRKF